MIIDTSALAAILLEEEDGHRFLQKITQTSGCVMSSANYVELGILYIRKLRRNDFAFLESLFLELEIEVVEVTPKHAQLAMLAYSRYGKTFHPAALNFGDCFAYALAVSLQLPLLFKGTDFQKTDVLVA